MSGNKNNPFDDDDDDDDENNDDGYEEEASTSNSKHSNYLDYIQYASNLRNEFADLYGDENAAREILRRALITFDPSISNTTVATTTTT